MAAFSLCAREVNLHFITKEKMYTKSGLVLVNSMGLFECVGSINLSLLLTVSQ